MKRVPRIVITRLCRNRTIADTAAGRGVTSITFMASSSTRRAPEAATSGEYFSGCRPRLFSFAGSAGWLALLRDKDGAASLLAPCDIRRAITRTFALRPWPRSRVETRTLRPVSRAPLPGHAHSELHRYKRPRPG